ncbi:MAG: hypothetical protein KBD83_08500 [Gammaproteobacteria bacterium]|nr:hypothetical protein [Gammaproteobacteria bacterium]
MKKISPLHRDNRYRSIMFEWSHWTKEGLLDAIETTEPGYQFYSVKMVERILQIKQIDACGFIG